MNNNGLLFGILCFIGAAVAMTLVGNFISPEIGNITASYYTKEISDTKQTGTENTVIPRQTEEAVKEPVEKTDLGKKEVAAKPESDTFAEKTSDEVVKAESETVTPDIKEAVPEEAADSAETEPAEIIKKEVGTVTSDIKEAASEDAAGSDQLEAAKKKIAELTEQKAETVSSDVKEAFTEIVEKKEEATEIVEKKAETVTSYVEEAAEVVVTKAETVTPDVKTTEPEEIADSGLPEEVKEEIAEKSAEKDKKIVKTAEDVSKITKSLKNGEKADLGDGRVAYKVKSGDTFSRICQKVLGTSSTWKEEAQKMGIDHRKIFPGKVLIFETPGE